MLTEYYKKNIERFQKSLVKGIESFRRKEQEVSICS